jgi:hypothetical protein
MLGPRVASTTIFEEPLREFYNTRVSFDDLYGINCCFWFANEDITFPRALRLALICLASSSLVPLEVVLLTRSDPAKSTRVNLPVIF